MLFCAMMLERLPRDGRRGRIFRTGRSDQHGIAGGRHIPEKGDQYLQPEQYQAQHVQAAEDPSGQLDLDSLQYHSERFRLCGSGKDAGGCKGKRWAGYARRADHQISG